MGASGQGFLGNFVQGTEMGLAGEWGDAVVSQLADHLAQTQPGLRGFARSNLFRMRQFYEV
ncbi:hypothetical protein PSCICG_44590 [Pseudomonas cichorii]|nr:hypothetical protein PSCICG_44590 [Pseudomonas cichorii]